MSDPIYKNSTNLGDGKSDLILNTAGKVIIKVKDRYHILNYNSESEEKNKTEKDEVLTDLIILESDQEVEEALNSLTKNSVIITSEGTLYLYLNGNTYPINFENSDNNIFDELIVNDKFELNGEFIIKNSNLIQNLNAQYLNGFTSDSFIKLNFPQTISEIWTFANDIYCNKRIIDSSKNTILDFKESNLNIDSITVKNLTVLSDESDNIQEDETNEDYISNKTYIGPNTKIISSDFITKTEFPWNENWANGGDPIIELIINAIEQGQLEEYYIDDEDNSYSYYVNRLLDVSTNESFTNLINVTNEMFYEDNLYQNYYYRPKNVDTVWVNTPFDESSNAKIEIYDKWFNKNNYVSELNQYNGNIWNIELNTNPYKIGDIVKYETEFLTITGLVTKSSNKDVNIITDSEDCESLIESDSNKEEDCYTRYAPIKNSSLLTNKSISVIGNISDVENSIFGTLSGYGFTSEENCYFVNPKIALVNNKGLNYIKLTSIDQSFIGKNSKNENFITIDLNGSCKIQRNNMYNINNNETSCSFGPIVVNEDGSATIGKGQYVIEIDSTGKISIPSECVN